MREILFRGKRKAHDYWIIGDLVRKKDYCFIYFAGAPREVDSETVGQYTGLTDKNGLTKIFENDIISAHPDELFPDDEIRLVVEWHDYGWFGKDSKGRYTSLESKWVSEFFEVIGNRFDNPELLGGEENG